MLIRWLVLLVGLLATPVTAVSSAALLDTSVQSVRVSGESPFAGCDAGSSGTLYGNAEAEASVAVNPTNPSNLVGAWQQDRWSGGAARGAVAGYSFDGGKSWRAVPLPFTACVEGGLAYARASDPWVSFGSDGTVYATALALGESGSTAVVAATSVDGGGSWANAREILVDGGNPRQFFNDKSSVTADPGRPGVAYAVWDRILGGQGEPDQGPRSGAPRAPAYFAKTEDGGRTWSEPRAITRAEDGQTLGNQIVVDPRAGVLYNFFDLIGSSGRGRLSHTVAFVESADGGATWSEPRTVDTLRAAELRVPQSRETIRAGGIIPDAAIDPSSGKLYAVWMDSRFAEGRYPEVAITTSDDGGESWSQPVRVNPATGGPAFTPSVSVNAGGTVAVTYYDFRSRTSETTTLPSDYWVAFSTDGGASFGGETRLDGPFDLLSAPVSGGYFLGDYQGLEAAGDTFVSLFVRTNAGESSNRTDVYAAMVPAIKTPPPTATGSPSPSPPGRSEAGP